MRAKTKSYDLDYEKQAYYLKQQNNDNVQMNCNKIMFVPNDSRKKIAINRMYHRAIQFHRSFACGCYEWRLSKFQLWPELERIWQLDRETRTRNRNNTYLAFADYI